MQHWSRLGLIFALPLLALSPALAQPPRDVDIGTGGPKMSMVPGPKPDPGHIPFVLPKDIKWHGENGEYQATLFGDPNKPGIYGIMIRWEPGHFSKPHFHSSARYIYVAKGNWWVSSSTTFDPDKTYPIPEGSVVTDIAKTVHWDGAKGKPCILILVGTGPVTTTRLVQTDPNKPDFTLPADKK